MSGSFFDEQLAQSRVKALIVQKYFKAWAQVILTQVKRQPPDAGRLAYIDLFAGPGRYKDGAASTPLMILEHATSHPDLSERLVTCFNDADPAHCKSLEAEFAKLPGLGKLRHKPQVSNMMVGEEIAKELGNGSLVPTLFFVDPWGYKGLSLGLINSVLKDWGSDVIIFFNYNRINMGVGNDLVTKHMDALLGAGRSLKLRERLKGMNSGDRENAIIEELSQSLIEMGGKYVLPFRFRDPNGTRTSHHLVFVSKHHLGYNIMKGIMAKESSRIEQGVGSLEYSPADERFPTLFGFNRPLDELENELCKTFAGHTLTRSAVFGAHNYGYGTPFIDANYRQALLNLEAQGRIRTSPPANERKKNTLAEHVVIEFPNPPVPKSSAKIQAASGGGVLKRKAASSPVKDPS